MWSPHIQSAQPSPILDSVNFSKKYSELLSILCIQTILDSPRETETFQLLSDVLGIKTKMLKTTHKNLHGLAPVSIFNVISKHTSLPYLWTHWASISPLKSHVSSHCRAFIHATQYVLNALHYFLSLVKFSMESPYIKRMKWSGTDWKDGMRWWKVA